jgi:undecaprenyl pyrophosphate phosphatase UppP
MSGIHYWTIGVVFLISLAGSNYVISKFEYIKVHEPAYRQFVITVTMFAIILFFMALLVKKVTDNEFQNLMLYGTLPVMVNFLMVFTKWILHKYRISRLEQKQREKEEHRAKEGLYGGL